ncbi:hypothetical protein CYMTET_37944 [Cymbomonas tetramitiformis]|uniref:Uncharacterized protein n=1 Tax=Cymbomonas tetramitiformis TaxID=36881 RepID=A0AAE0CEG0_9CHLO|nr:hypothetical protein CYMTET_37944 [Cymbomonas tetramitiformis]
MVGGSYKNVVLPSSAPRVWVPRSALGGGACVRGVLLPGARINLCKEARCAWTRCARCALPPGTMRLVCLAGQRRVTQPETAQRELLPHGGAPGALAVAAICHSRRALSPPKEKRSAPGRFTLGGPKGRARVSTLVCSPRGDTHARVGLLARAWRCVPSRRVHSPGAWGSPASSAPRAWVPRSARGGGACVRGVLLPGARINLCKEARCAWTRCTR